MKEPGIGESADDFVARRVVRWTHFEVDAAPETVFPLLCPVREREWIENWEAAMVYSASGVVEGGCIFTTVSPLLGKALYVTSRHEPEAGRVEFVVFFPGTCVQKLDIAVSPRAGGGSRLHWSRTYTGLSREGNALIEGITEEAFQKQMTELARSLSRHATQIERK